MLDSQKSFIEILRSGTKVPELLCAAPAFSAPFNVTPASE